MNTYHLTKIKQHFQYNSITDIKAEVSKELLKLRPLINADAHIAIAVGSRGIKNLVPVVKEVAKFIKENNAIPFLVPAMGSHGGGTAESQKKILSEYGVSVQEVSAAPWG